MTDHPDYVMAVRDWGVIRSCHSVWCKLAVLCLVLYMGMPACSGDTNVTVLASLGEIQYYLYHTEPGVTWFQALDQCTTDSRRLAVLDHPDKINLIDDNLKDSMTGAWLGARPNLTLADWRLFNGENIPTGNSFFSERSDPDGNCLMLDYQYSFQKEFCGKLQTAKFVCQFQLPNYHCNSSQEQPSCFILFTHGTTISWFGARAECQSEGGDLAGQHAPVNPNEWLNLVPDINQLTQPAYVGGYRMPWWWMDGKNTGLGEVIYYDWTPGEENYGNDSCLTVIPEGWVPRHCNASVEYFICEGTNEMLTQDTSTTMNMDNTASGLSKNLQIIIGSLVGGVVVLVVIIVVLVLCLRRAKKENKEMPDFQFVGVSSTTSSSMNTIQTSTIGTQASPQYEYAGDVIHMGTDPHSVVNQAYEEADEGMGSSITSTKRAKNPRDVHYASSSIDSVIERGSKVLGEDGGGSGTKEKKGVALNGLKKRLSLLMKREYQPNRGALPTAPNTLQKSPDVVPMTSLGVYEDISQIQSQGQRANNVYNAIPEPVVSRDPQPISDKVTYAEVDHSKRSPDDLVIVDNENYAHM